MRVLIVCSESFKQGCTGDATQARETVVALRALGDSVDCLYVNYCPIRFSVDDGSPVPIDKLHDFLLNYDVVHLLPGNQVVCRIFRRESPVPVVASTIFWSGWERVSIALREIPILDERLHWAVRYFKQNLPWSVDCRGVDVFLPNSQAEAKKVMEGFRHDRRSVAIPVPNGFVRPDVDIKNLPRHSMSPTEDYLVVPGIFAWRKNQSSLIRSLKGFSHPIIFLGGAAGGTMGPYFELCKRLATPNMIFMGFVSSASKEYWQLLRHARCACLVSDCETPGIAMIEAAYAGARPVITKFGGTQEYFGFDAEYLDPRSTEDIRVKVDRAWQRGRLSDCAAESYGRYTWKYCAEITRQAYELAINVRGGRM